MPIVRRSTTGPLRPAENPSQTGVLSSQTGVLSTATGGLRTNSPSGPLPSLRPGSEQSIAQLRQRLHSKIINELRDSVDLSDDLGKPDLVLEMFANRRYGTRPRDVTQKAAPRPISSGPHRR